MPLCSASGCLFENTDTIKLGHLNCVVSSKLWYNHEDLYASDRLWHQSSNITTKPHRRPIPAHQREDCQAEHWRCEPADTVDWTVSVPPWSCLPASTEASVNITSLNQAVIITSKTHHSKRLRFLLYNNSKLSSIWPHVSNDFVRSKRKYSQNCSILSRMSWVSRCRKFVRPGRHIWLHTS